MPKSSMDKQAEFNYKFGQLATFAGLKGIRFGHPKSGFIRDAEEQNKLFKAGRSKCDGYKEKSTHQLGLARDIFIIDEKGNAINDYGDHPYYEVLGRFWEECLGHTWGGNFARFKDVFHFEY